MMELDRYDESELEIDGRESLEATRQVNEARENVKQLALAAPLNAHGVFDRRELFHRGKVWFQDEDFPPHGKGKAYARFVLGEDVDLTNITHDTLKLVADKLCLEDFSQHSIDKCKRVFARFDVHNRIDLLMKGSYWFRDEDFKPDFKSGKTFAKFVLDRSVRNISKPILNEIADKLGFPEIKESDYVLALERQGIFDRHMIHHNGPGWFKRTSFPPFKKGTQFMRMLFPECQDVNHEVLAKIAERLNLEDFSDRTKARYKKVLYRQGVYSLSCLQTMGIENFLAQPFPPYSSGYKFMSALFEGNFSRRQDMFPLIAKKLDLPLTYVPNDEARGDMSDPVDLYLSLFDDESIYERKDLLSRGPDWFVMKSWGPFPNGADFASAILGYEVEEVDEDTLVAILDKLEFIDEGDVLMRDPSSGWDDLLIYS